MLAKLAVIDCLHGYVCCNEVSFLAVPNEHTGIAVFIDHPWVK